MKPKGLLIEISQCYHVRKNYLLTKAERRQITFNQHASPRSEISIFNWVSENDLYDVVNLYGLQSH